MNLGRLSRYVRDVSGWVGGVNAISNGGRQLALSIVDFVDSTLFYSNGISSQSLQVSMKRLGILFGRRNY